MAFKRTSQAEQAKRDAFLVQYAYIFNRKPLSAGAEPFCEWLDQPEVRLNKLVSLMKSIAADHSSKVPTLYQLQQSYMQLHRADFPQVEYRVDCEMCRGHGFGYYVKGGANPGTSKTLLRDKPEDHPMYWTLTVPCQCEAGMRYNVSFGPRAWPLDAIRTMWRLAAFAVGTGADEFIDDCKLGGSYANATERKPSAGWCKADDIRTVVQAGAGDRVRHGSQLVRDVLPERQHRGPDGGGTGQAAGSGQASHRPASRLLPPPPPHRGLPAAGPA